MARAVAAQTKSTFKVVGPQLVQMFLGDGAKLVCRRFRVLFCFSILVVYSHFTIFRFVTPSHSPRRERPPSSSSMSSTLLVSLWFIQLFQWFSVFRWVFIVSLVGTERFDSEKAGNREMQRIPAERRHQGSKKTVFVDDSFFYSWKLVTEKYRGFHSSLFKWSPPRTESTCPTHPAPIGSSRQDLPHPNEEARAWFTRVRWTFSESFFLFSLLLISVEIRVAEGLRSDDGRFVISARTSTSSCSLAELTHEDFMDAILEVQSKKKMSQILVPNCMFSLFITDSSLFLLCVKCTFSS